VSRTPAWLLAGVVGLLALAAVTPTLIALVGALLPLIVVAAVAVLALRLVFFHTRRW
jgi:hypothetical protein